MLSNLYLLRFNNYYNRQVKGVNYKLEDYYDFIQYGPDAENSYKLMNVNFNPADGVDTQQVVNTPDADYDYLLVIDAIGNISRWFIIQSTRNLIGQYTLTLHRDLIVDNYEAVINSPAYIERAMLNANDKLIFNSENMMFNQIKQKEVLLKDSTDCPWIVGYISDDYFNTGSLPTETGEKYIEFDRNIDKAPQLSYSYLELQEIISKANGYVYSGANKNNQDLRLSVKLSKYSKVGYRLSQTQYNLDLGYGPGFIQHLHDPNVNVDFSGSVGDFSDFVNDSFAGTMRRYFIGAQSLPNYINGYELGINDLIAMNGQIVRNTDAEGPATFSVSFKQIENTTYVVVPPVGSGVYNDIKQTLTNAMDYYGLADYLTFDDNKPNSFEVYVPLTKYKLEVTNYAPRVVARSYLGNEKNPKISLVDAPYTMFCMPYKNINVRRDSGVHILYTSDKSVCMEMATELATVLGKAVYDIQLLPYSPIQGLINSAGEIDLTNLSEKSYSLITSQAGDGTFPMANNCGIILFPERSSFSFVIELDEEVVLPTDATELKIDNETKFCRLVSPNYAGAFEFKPTKNGGFSSVEINCSYKPYQPYIHLNPLFNSGYLYGGDFNDNRGLICGGDFSIPLISSEWSNYQIQNKSYMESFNRQVENMETNYNIQREQAATAGGWSVATSALSGATSGAISVGTIGGPIGAGVGAAIGLAGGVASGVGGLNADLKAADALHAEATSYAKDQFNLSLQNIQAIPSTMSRTSAFDINNKLFPFIEFYDATDREKSALRNKIKYSSMSVMAIGAIKDYIQSTPSYVSAQLIKVSDDLAEDYHLATSIASELHKGIYI